MKDTVLFVILVFDITIIDISYITIVCNSSFTLDKLKDGEEWLNSN